MFNTPHHRGPFHIALRRLLFLHSRHNASIASIARGGFCRRCESRLRNVTKCTFIVSRSFPPAPCPSVPPEAPLSARGFCALSGERKNLICGRRGGARNLAGHSAHARNAHALVAALTVSVGDCPRYHTVSSAQFGDHNTLAVDSGDLCYDKPRAAVGGQIAYDNS